MTLACQIAPTAARRPPVGRKAPSFRPYLTAFCSPAIASLKDIFTMIKKRRRPAPKRPGHSPARHNPARPGARPSAAARPAPTAHSLITETSRIPKLFDPLDPQGLAATYWLDTATWEGQPAGFGMSPRRRGADRKRNSAPRRSPSVTFTGAGKRQWSRVLVTLTSRRTASGEVRPAHPGTVKE